eukprot:CAMPEP_0116122508 /NCGR_PEP_ID=MMETSP0329-20121206/4252_1 /TAXON_ID=697910 /ORGANISM="Pseudo-nitzschia arenysensis, Strain B593" /LENGTH=184 /DNA_ID=CAMNT_0003616361 /DNA_START=23 /DNA_END=574 /DNA_ORIENTATION=+
MVCFDTNGVRRGFIRSRNRFRDNRWSMKSVAWPDLNSSPMLRRHRRHRQRGHKTLNSNPSRSNSTRLMECFDTPPKRTIFGTKNSEHWDSFQSKYSSSFDSSPKQYFERDGKAIRRRYKLQAWNHDDRIQPPEVRRKKLRRSKKWRLLWLVMGCWQSPRSSSRCDVGNELEFQRSNYREEDFDE